MKSKNNNYLRERNHERKSHDEQIVRWANFVKNNKNWKLKMKPFIDAQIIIANRFYKNLEKMPDGKERIKLLKRISA